MENPPFSLPFTVDFICAINYLDHLLLLSVMDFPFLQFYFWIEGKTRIRPQGIARLPSLLRFPPLLQLLQEKRWKDDEIEQNAECLEVSCKHNPNHIRLE